VATAFLAAYALSQRQAPSFPIPFGRQQVNWADWDLYVVAKTVVSIVNIALLLVLVLNYASIFLKTRSQFTIGLLIFAFVFLMKDLASSPFLVGAFGFGLWGYGLFVLWFALLPDVFELAALSVLLYLSVKY
jgi:hypothetical protein